MSGKQSFVSKVLTHTKFTARQNSMNLSLKDGCMTTVKE
jgi:hypothetical protein